MNIGQLIAGTGLILLAFIIVLIIGMMRIFKKAGRPQLSAVFPVLNLIEYSNIAGKPGWWGIAICALPMIPFGENMIANILAGGISLTMLIILTHELSKNFGKGADFTAGLVLLPGVFHCVLGFGNAEYRGPEGSTKRAIYEEKKGQKDSNPNQDSQTE